MIAIENPPHQGCCCDHTWGHRGRGAVGEVEMWRWGEWIASYPMACFVCGRAIETGSKFTYVPFGQRGALVATHIECGGDGGSPRSCPPPSHRLRVPM